MAGIPAAKPVYPRAGRRYCAQRGLRRTPSWPTAAAAAVARSLTACTMSDLSRFVANKLNGEWSASNVSGVLTDVIIEVGAGQAVEKRRLPLELAHPPSSPASAPFPEQCSRFAPPPSPPTFQYLVSGEKWESLDPLVRSRLLLAPLFMRKRDLAELCPALAKLAAAGAADKCVLLDGRRQQGRLGGLGGAAFELWHVD